MPRWESEAWKNNGQPLDGSPPEDHPRRCKAKRRNLREQCRKWALKGSDYCKFHGGRHRISRKGLPKRYAKFLGPTLRKAVEELSKDPHFDQVNLYDEIAISRIAAGNALKLAEPVLMGEVEVKESAKMVALDLTKEAMNHVRDMVVAAAKIERDANAKVSLRVVDLIIMQIIKAVHEVCSDKELADKIAEHINENVRLPAQLNADVGATVIDGVESTPDMIVSEMDESVCGDGL
jgi:hypothetical protein